MGAGSYIVALNRDTGAEVWRDERKNRRSWATPLLVTTGGRTELIASGAEAVIAYDPRSGKELWRTAGTKGHPIPSSATGFGLVFAFAGNAESSKMVVAFRPGAEGEKDGTRVVWRYTRGTAYVASPILYGEYLYMVNDMASIVTCLEATTGRTMWQGRLGVAQREGFSASPVAMDGKIFFTNDYGETFVVRAGPKFELLHVNKMGEPILASPALVDGQWYVRTERNLIAIGANSQK